MTLARALAFAIVAFAVVVRLPHYDVAWFGLDSVQFITEGRSILVGNWNIVGPRASGLDVIGPLYSFLVAGILWLRDMPSDVALVAAVGEVAAAWFAFDAGRRLSGLAGGVAAGVGYILAPILAVGTRVIWNPSLLPAVVAFGWWMAIRYAQSPSISRLAGTAFLVSLTLTLHATAVFQVAGLVLAILLIRRLSAGAIVAAALAGIVPLLPVLFRLAGGGSPGSMAERLALPADLSGIAAAVADITLGFPRLLPHWSGMAASAALYVQAVLAVIGLGVALMKRSPSRPIWIGVAAAIVAHLCGALVYRAPIAWHHFIALAPVLSLAIGHAVAAVPRGRLPLIGLSAAACASQLLFIVSFDRLALDSGWIHVNTQWVALHAPAGSAYGLHLRTLESTGRALQGVGTAGRAAELVGHGARAELWRETGGPFVPPVTWSRLPMSSEFVLMGPGATPVSAGAWLAGERVCVFDASRQRPWRAGHTPPVGWEQGGFDDAAWTELRLPARATPPGVPSSYAAATWLSPQLFLRSRFDIVPGQTQLVSVAMRGEVGGSDVHAFFAGAPLAPRRTRTIGGLLAQTREWLFELAGPQAGGGVLALAITGERPQFDLDVFEVPCVDADWYH